MHFDCPFNVSFEGGACYLLELTADGPLSTSCTLVSPVDMRKDSQGPEGPVVVSETCHYVLKNLHDIQLYACAQLEVTDSWMLSVLTHL